VTIPSSIHWPIMEPKSQFDIGLTRWCHKYGMMGSNPWPTVEVGINCTCSLKIHQLDLVSVLLANCIFTRVRELSLRVSFPFPG